MPVSEYFKGHGKEVMTKMKKKYGGKKGQQVFYATANKHGLDTGPSNDVKKKHGVK
jgi:hypothetical protein